MGSAPPNEFVSILCIQNAGLRKKLERLWLSQYSQYARVSRGVKSNAPIIWAAWQCDATGRFIGRRFGRSRTKGILLHGSPIVRRQRKREGGEELWIAANLGGSNIERRGALRTVSIAKLVNATGDTLATVKTTTRTSVNNKIARRPPNQPSSSIATGSPLRAQPSKLEGSEGSGSKC